jgi:phage terminase small subunit
VHWRRKHGLKIDALHRHRVRGTLLKAYRFAYEAGKLKGKSGRKSSLPETVQTLLTKEPDAGRNLAALARTLGANPATLRKIAQRWRQGSVTNSG